MLWTTSGPIEGGYPGSISPGYPPSVEKPFFDSVRKTYPEFNAWFTRGAQADRKAWIAKLPRERLGAICIFKEELPEKLTLTGKQLRPKALKLGMLKVSEPLQRQKIGTRLIKTAIAHAKRYRIPFLYVTFYQTKTAVKQFMKSQGFKFFGRYWKNPGEVVYIKDLRHLSKPSV